MKSVYVYTTGLQLNVHKDIIKNLKKNKKLAVIDDPEEADAVLRFNWNRKYNTPAKGYAFIGRRLVWEFEDIRRTVLEKPPSTNFARAFLKLLE